MIDKPVDRRRRRRRRTVFTCKMYVCTMPYLSLFVPLYPTYRSCFKEFRPPIFLRNRYLDTDQRPMIVVLRRPETEPRRITKPLVHNIVCRKFNHPQNHTHNYENTKRHHRTSDWKGTKTSNKIVGYQTTTQHDVGSVSRRAWFGQENYPIHWHTRTGLGVKSPHDTTFCDVCGNCCFPLHVFRWSDISTG